MNIAIGLYNYMTDSYDDTVQLFFKSKKIKDTF